MKGYNCAILEKSIHNCFNRATEKRSPDGLQNELRSPVFETL